MNHATSIGFRAVGLCSISRAWPQLLSTLSRCFRHTRLISSLPGPKQAPRHVQPLLTSRFVLHRPFHASTILRKLKPYDTPEESGLTFRKTPLNSDELLAIFGPANIDIETANRFLRVLHARRIDGTLDLPFDPAIIEACNENEGVADAGLEWLRLNYPVDEDDAILRRFAREESPRVQEHPSALTERGQKLGLYKTQDETQASDPEFQAQQRERQAQTTSTLDGKSATYYGPQSGSYYAELSENEQDPSGKSVFAKMRERNQAQEAKELKELDEEIEQSMATATAKAQARSQALEKAPEQGLEISKSRGEVRPPNEFEKWVIRARKKATSDLTLESPEVQRLTKAGRILPAFLFVVLGLAGLYLYTQQWTPPRRADRWMPDTSLAYATCYGILAANVLIFLAWRFPPTIGLMNRYFVVTPGFPRVFSMLGNTFSHTTFNHLFWNMFGLFVFGPALHEDLGRANFLAIYVGAGLFGSLVSMSSYVLRGILYTSSLGASGCIWGIMSSYFWLYRDKEFQFWFLPDNLKDNFTYTGQTILIAILLLDVATPWFRRSVDVVAHAGGYVFGILATQWWKQNDPRARKLRPVRKSSPGINLFGGKDNKD